MNKKELSVMENIKVALLPVLHDPDMRGVDAVNLALCAVDQHIKDLDDAKNMAKLLRTYAKHIVEMRC